jgi:hypothetical protein
MDFSRNSGPKTAHRRRKDRTQQQYTEVTRSRTLSSITETETSKLSTRNLLLLQDSRTRFDDADLQKTRDEVVGAVYSGTHSSLMHVATPHSPHPWPRKSRNNSSPCATAFPASKTHTETLFLQTKSPELLSASSTKRVTYQNSLSRTRCSISFIRLAGRMQSG